MAKALLLRPDGLAALADSPVQAMTVDATGAVARTPGFARFEGMARQ